MKTLNKLVIGQDFKANGFIYRLKRFEGEFIAVADRIAKLDNGELEWVVKRTVKFPIFTKVESGQITMWKSDTFEDLLDVARTLIDLDRPASEYTRGICELIGRYRLDIDGKGESSGENAQMVWELL